MSQEIICEVRLIYLLGAGLLSSIRELGVFRLIQRVRNLPLNTINFSELDHLTFHVITLGLLNIFGYLGFLLDLIIAQC